MPAARLFDRQDHGGAERDAREQLGLDVAELVERSRRVANGRAQLYLLKARNELWAELREEGTEHFAQRFSGELAGVS